MPPEPDNTEDMYHREAMRVLRRVLAAEKFAPLVASEPGYSLIVNKDNNTLDLFRYAHGESRLACRYRLSDTE